MGIGRAIVAVLIGTLTNFIYGAVMLVYNLLYDIANTTLFTGTEEGSIGSFGHNIYTILGVIMLFKLAFSLLTYIINPDEFSDKNKGFGAVIKNVVFVIGLTLLVPIIFEQAMNLQRIVLKEDIIGRVITGVSREGGTAFEESAGETMAFNLLAPFIVPNLDVCDDFSSLSTDDKNTCMEAVGAIDSDAANKYINAYNDNNYSGLLDYNIITASDNDDEDLFHFDWVLAPLVGVVTFYILLLFCIDVAVRSVKLLFYQLIAPIPIVSYIDPKGQSGLFKKWVNMCVTTYLDLFIRLAAIYFAIFIITEVINGGGMQTIVNDAEGNAVYQAPNPMVVVFMMLGCLMFAKEIPKLISDLTGIKLDGGGFNLNPSKKIAGAALGGAAIASGLNLVGRTGKNLGKGLGAGVKGVVQKGAATALHDPNAANMKWYGNAGRHLGKIPIDAMGTIGGGLMRNHQDRTKAKYQDIVNLDSEMKKIAEEQIKSGKAGNLSIDYNTELEKVESIRARTIDANLPKAKRIQLEQDRATDLRNAEAKLKQVLDDSIDFYRNGKDKGGNDVTVSEEFRVAKERYKYKAAAAGVEVLENASDIHKQAQNLQKRIGDIDIRQSTYAEAKKK